MSAPCENSACFSTIFDKPVLLPLKRAIITFMNLKEHLASLTRRGELWKPEKDGVRCFACGHRCFIPTGFSGICKVRFNDKNELRVPWGYVAGTQIDPIEKKPFFHVLPGASTLSFGMLGCDFHCSYCQNWITSQALRDSSALSPPIGTSAEEIIQLGKKYGASIFTSTYNEPLITSEWAVHIFSETHRLGFKNAYVSNGNATEEVLDYLRPHVDFYKVDLKGFDDRHYRSLGGVLSNVTKTVQDVFRRGFWLEVVTLIIPGFNDGDDELKRLTHFLASVSPHIPWHATAYHPDYKMRDRDATPIDTLFRAAEIATAAGLKFVYLGNRPGNVGEWENTRCPKCRVTLVERHGYRIVHNRITGNNCPDCGEAIPGYWIS